MSCQFQADVEDKERFDTTITVPYNLDDGNYVIQLMAFVANSPNAIYSCAKIAVFGGTSNMACAAPQSIPAASGCVVASAPGVGELPHYPIILSWKVGRNFFKKLFQVTKI